MPPRRTPRTQPQTGQPDPVQEQPQPQPVQGKPQPEPALTPVEEMLASNNFQGLAQMAAQADDIAKWIRENNIPDEKIWSIIKTMLVVNPLNPEKAIRYLNANISIMNWAIPTFSEKEKIYLMYNGVKFWANNLVELLLNIDGNLVIKILESMPTLKGKGSFLSYFYTVNSLKSLRWKAFDADPKKIYEIFLELSRASDKFHDEDDIHTTLSTIFDLAVSEGNSDSMVSHYGLAALGVPEMVSAEIPNMYKVPEAEESVVLAPEDPTFSNVVDALEYLLPSYREKSWPPKSARSMRSAAEKEEKVFPFESTPEYLESLKRQEEILKGKGLPAEKIKNILLSFKYGYEKRMREKGGEKSDIQQQISQSAKDFFRSKLEEGEISAKDLLKSLNKLTMGKIGPEVVKMLSAKNTWNERSLYILLDNLISSLETATRFRGKFKPFNYDVHVDTRPGFIHEQVSNPKGFAIYLTWRDLPDDIKPMEEYMMQSQAAAHARDIKDLVGYMGVTPWNEKVGRKGEEKINKKIWVVQEVQAPMLDPDRWTGDKNSKKLQKLNYYLGDWYKVLWNQVVKLAKRFGIDEVWSATPQAVATQWPGGGETEEDYHGGEKYTYMRGKREELEKKLNSESFKNTASPEDVKKLKGEISAVTHPWDRYYEDTPRSLGADKISINQDLPYMGNKIKGNNKFWRIKVGEVPREKIAVRRRLLKRVAHFTRMASVDIKSVEDFVNSLADSYVLDSIVAREDPTSVKRAFSWVYEACRILSLPSLQMIYGSLPAVRLAIEQRGYSKSVGTAVSNAIKEAVKRLTIERLQYMNMEDNPFVTLDTMSLPSYQQEVHDIMGNGDRRHSIRLSNRTEF